jgi:ATP-binding cassette subfamily B protein RaxB
VLTLQNLFRKEALEHRAERHLGEPDDRRTRALAPRRPRTRVPVIHQTEATDCGLACLAMILRAQGAPTTLQDLRAEFPVSVRGTTIADIVTMAGRLDMAPRPVKAELDQLHQLATPCILHWDMNHYVVLEGVDRTHAQIVDPASGRRRLGLTDVSKHFTGIALELPAPATVSELPSGHGFTFGHLLAPLKAMRRAALRVLVAACLVEAAALVAPLFLQVAVDRAVKPSNAAVLPMLAMIFTAVVLAHAGLTWVRALLVGRLGLDFAQFWLGRVYARLVRLPMAFFQARYISDIISRFRGVREIQTTLSVSAVESVLDGAMGLVTVVILFAYSRPLALLSLAAMVLYAAIRRAVARRQIEAATELLQHNIRQQAYLHETIKGIQPIKLSVSEPMRLAGWSNMLVAASNREARVQRLVAVTALARALITGLENVATIAVGAALVIDARWSLGMFFAYFGFKTLFQLRSFALIDKLAEVSLLRPHLDQLADVLCAEAEPDIGRSDNDPEITSLELRGVGFRYSPLDPVVLDHCTIHAERGETVAISGTSGAGKTTLIKLLVGLLAPTHGELIVNGRRLDTDNVRWYRARVGAVMQDDQLVGGTIGENICFTDPRPDLERIRHCARLARIDADIEHMPMRYDTPCGDMGSTLSGGQRQRILLARALYRRPQILVLDEATSNLDPENERLIFENLRDLPMIKVLVAHRHETLQVADRRVTLHHGRIDTPANPERIAV